MNRLVTSVQQSSDASRFICLHCPCSTPMRTSNGHKRGNLISRNSSIHHVCAKDAFGPRRTQVCEMDWTMGGAGQDRAGCVGGRGGEGVGGTAWDVWLEMWETCGQHRGEALVRVEGVCGVELVQGTCRHKGGVGAMGAGREKDLSAQGRDISVQGRTRCRKEGWRKCRHTGRESVQVHGDGRHAGREPCQHKGRTRRGGVGQGGTRRRKGTCQHRGVGIGVGADAKGSVGTGEGGVSTQGGTRRHKGG
jgi:hypothetical protein